MKNLKIKLGVGVLVILVAGSIFLVSRSPSKNPYSQSDKNLNTEDTAVLPVPKDTTPKNSTEKTYSMSEVASHNDAKSCWTTIRGDVYDVTPWINVHPGGTQAILSLCGKDGTEAFTGQHGGQKRPESELSGFIIGKLK